MRVGVTLFSARHERPLKLKPWHPRAAVVLVVVIVLVAAQRLGLLAQLSEPEQLTRTLLELGPWGYVAFIGVFATFQPFGIPGTVFVFAAALVWPWQIAFVLSMAGSMAASVVGFSFARFVARDFLSRKIPARFRKYDDALERRALATVFLLRSVFWSAPLLHAFFGVSKVPFRTHFSGSFLGYLLPLFLMSFFGQKLFELLKHAPREAWVLTAVAIVVGAVGVFLFRRRAARGADATARTTSPPAEDS